MSRLRETLLTTVLVFGAGVAVLPIGRASTSAVVPVLRRVAAGMAKQENSLRSISIWGAARYRRAISGAGSSPVTVERVDFVATFDGLPQGRYRFFARRVLRLCPNGAGPHFKQQSYSAAYNGRVVTYLKTLDGPVNKPFKVLVGRVSGWKPKAGRVFRNLSGWTYSIFGYPAQISEYERLSQIIAAPPKGFSVTAAAKHATGGRAKVVLTITNEALRIVLVLAPERGYSIIAGALYLRSPPMASIHSDINRGTLSKKPFAVFRVRSFWEPTDGVWFPRSVTASTYTPDGHLRSEFFLHVTKVRLNNPEVNADTYVVHFPVGARVLDESTGRSIHVGGTPRQQVKAIEKAAAVNLNWRKAIIHRCRSLVQAESHFQRLMMANKYAVAAKILARILEQMPGVADELRRAGWASIRRSRAHFISPYAVYITLCLHVDGDVTELGIRDWKEARPLIGPSLKLVRSNNHLRTAMDKLTHERRLLANVVVAQESEYAGKLCWRAHRRHEAIHFLHQAVPLYRKLAQTQPNGKADVFYARATEQYFVDLTGVSGFQGFLKDVAPIIAEYKNTSWICQAAMSIQYIPGFMTGGADPRRYAYFLVVQHQLAANHADPQMEHLYFDLGLTADALGLTKDEVKWYQRYLQLYPHSRLAPAVRKMLAGALGHLKRASAK
jgi:hypothetical protein